MAAKKKAAPRAASKKPAPSEAKGPTPAQPAPAEAPADPPPAAKPVAVVNPEPEVLPPQEVELSPGISLSPFLRVVASLQPFVQKAEALEAMAGRAVIESDETYAKGLQFLQIAIRDWDQVEALRKTIKGPIDDYGKLIQATFLPVLGRIDAAKGVVNKKMLTHKQAVEAKAREEQEAIRKKQQEEADRLAEAERKKGNEAGAAAIQEAAAVIPQREVVTSLSSVSFGGMKAGTRKVWQGTVAKPLDVLKAIIEGRVPISVLTWNQADLNRYAVTIKVKGELNGILIDEVESLATRGGR
jgi:hypothetical protein